MKLIRYNPHQQLAHQVRTKRKILKMTQAELAVATETAQSAIARIENAHGNPTFEVIRRLSDTLDADFRIWVHPAKQGPNLRR